MLEVTYTGEWAPLMRHVNEGCADIRFRFNSTEHLVDLLFSVDQDALQRLRHVSVRGHPFPLYLGPEAPFYTTFQFTTVLQLFPGLQSDTLEVRNTYHEPGTFRDEWGDEAAFHMVQDLIESDGFKELIYTSADECFMMPNEFEAVPADSSEMTKEISSRDPQPSTWDRLIKERDGADSGAGVELYRHTHGNWLKDEYESEKKPLSPDNVEFTATNPASVRGSATAQDRGRPGEIQVRVKRGKDADYVQTGRSGHEGEDELHDLFKKYSWKETKEHEWNVGVTDDDPAAHL